MNSNAGGRNKKKQRSAKGGIGKHAYANRLRYAEDGEMYACVEKMVGNGRVLVVGADGKSYSCVIRQKFKGRNKRDSLMVAGTWCLVGVREWESRQNGPPVCDLLHVYRDTDVSTLKARETTALTALIVAEEATKTTGDSNTVGPDDAIIFTNKDDCVPVESGDIFEDDGCIEEELGVGGTVGGGSDEEVDFDDI
jgi:initiation factor 1A